MDDLIGDNFSEQGHEGDADSQIRRAYADSILRIRDAEEEAVQHIEQLLNESGDPFNKIPVDCGSGRDS